MDDSDERAVRTLDFLASIGLAEEPPGASYAEWAEWAHTRALFGHWLRRLFLVVPDLDAPVLEERPKPKPKVPGRAPSRPPGEAYQHNAVGLTPDAVRAIRRRRADGEDRKALAAEFGVTPAMVGMIANHRRHAHVPD